MALELETTLLERLLNESNPSALDEVLHVHIPQCIRETKDLGPAVEMAYVFGAQIAFVNRFLINPSMLFPNNPIIEDGRRAGVPKETISLLEKIVLIKSYTGRLEGNYIVPNHPEFGQMMKMCLGQDSLENLRKHQTKGLPVPEQEKAVAHLRKIRATMYFKEYGMPSTVVSVYIYGPLLDPMQTLTHVKDLRTLETLYLNGVPVTDDVLVLIRELVKLQKIEAIRTKISEKGAEALSAALPMATLTVQIADKKITWPRSRSQTNGR